LPSGFRAQVSEIEQEIMPGMKSEIKQEIELKEDRQKWEIPTMTTFCFNN
jgi:hypothetical protein